MGGEPGARFAVVGITFFLAKLIDLIGVTQIFVGRVTNPFVQHGLPAFEFKDTQNDLRSFSIVGSVKGQGGHRITLETACCEFSEPGDGFHKDNSLLYMKKTGFVRLSFLASLRLGVRFPFPVCSKRLPASFFHYAPSDKIRSGSLRDQTAGETGLDLYVRVVSQPTVL